MRKLIASLLLLFVLGTAQPASAYWEVEWQWQLWLSPFGAQWFYVPVWYWVDDVGGGPSCNIFPLCDDNR